MAMNTKLSFSRLPAVVAKGKKRIGRGHGSGKVKTGGRGTKGQRARGKIKAGFEGGQLPLIKRMPLLRGKGKLKSRKEKQIPVNILLLEKMPAGETITIESLRKYHIIDAGTISIKLVGKSLLSRPYTVTVPCSSGAKASVEKSGGSVR